MDELDNIDIQILKQLNQDSSLTTKELAQKVNLSPTPVFERVKRLERQGYIKKYIALLNAEKLNNGFIVFCNVKLKRHSKDVGNQFVSDIMKIDEIAECYNISGDYDFILKIRAKDMPHYQDIVFNKLGGVESIGHTHSTFVMSEIKASYTLPL